VVPCMRRVRPAVQQHDQRPAAPLQVSEPQPVGRDPALPQQSSHQPIIGRRLRPAPRASPDAHPGLLAPQRADQCRITTAGTPSTSRDRPGSIRGRQGSPVSPASANTQRDWGNGPPHVARSRTTCAHRCGRGSASPSSDQPFRYGVGAIPARCCAEPVSVVPTGIPASPVTLSATLAPGLAGHLAACGAARAQAIGRLVPRDRAWSPRSTLRPLSEAKKPPMKPATVAPLPRPRLDVTRPTANEAARRSGVARVMSSV
jgi:hypothetical protein